MKRKKYRGRAPLKDVLEAIAWDKHAPADYVLGGEVDHQLLYVKNTLGEWCYLVVEDEELSASCFKFLRGQGVRELTDEEVCRLR